MEIKGIFADNLYSFAYDNNYEHEYEKKIEQWGDIEYIYLKATENEIGEMSIDEFFDEIFFDRELIRSELKQHARTDSLCDIFACLYNDSKKLIELEPSKAKIWVKERKQLSRLRVYALRVSNQKYIITGGAIKFTLRMRDHPDTNTELVKFDQCREFLIKESFDEDDLVNIVFGN